MSNPQPTGVAIDRVVVVLDAVSEHRAALDTAARLAARWHARLHGVFVEDSELLRLATLPFARQVTLHAGVETLTRTQVEGQLRAFAERTRREVSAAARRHHVEGSFAVAHGAADAASVAASPGDFFVACSVTRPIGRHFRLECRAWSAGETAPPSFLLAHRHWGAGGSVIALVRDAGPVAFRLVDIAADIAAASGGRLIVMVAPDPAPDDDIARWLGERVADRDVPVAVEPAPQSRAALLRRIAELDGHLLAIEAGAAEAEPGYLRDIVGIACDVLIVR